MPNTRYVSLLNLHQTQLRLVPPHSLRNMIRHQTTVHMRDRMIDPKLNVQRRIVDILRLLQFSSLRRLLPFYVSLSLVRGSCRRCVGVGELFNERNTCLIFRVRHLSCRSLATTLLIANVHRRETSENLQKLPDRPSGSFAVGCRSRKPFCIPAFTYVGSDIARRQEVDRQAQRGNLGMAKYNSSSLLHSMSSSIPSLP